MTLAVDPETTVGELLEAYPEAEARKVRIKRP
jgi:hypothetical protein